MELSNNTLSILKNFSGINQNLMVREGNNLKTMSEARNILASANVDSNFPKEFGVYDLNEFINVLGLVDKPNLAFDTTHVVVQDASGISKVKYFFSPEETLTTPSKDIKMPDPDLSFELTNDVLNKLKKAAAVLGHNEVTITGKDGVVNLTVVDAQNSSSNAFTIDIAGKTPAVPFKFIMNIANLKIIAGDYNIGMSSKLISQFKHKEIDVTYWIACEKTSTFGE